jgi:hypothetical protein
MSGYRPLQRVLLSIAILLMAFSPLGSSGPVAARSTVYQYANGVTLTLGSSLPVYKVNKIAVNGDGFNALSSQVFNGIYDPINMDLQSDMLLGNLRLTGLNAKNNTIMEQFGATGGFYAYDPTRAFGDGSVIPNPTLNLAQAQSLACHFILLHSTILDPTSTDLQVQGPPQKCDHNFDLDPLYKTSLETLSGQDVSQGARPTADPLRIMVTLPLLVNTGLYNPQIPTTPLGGPGGHISMIFDTTLSNATTPSLDSGIPGLQAVAMPFFGRSLSFGWLVPAIDPIAVKDQVLAQIKATYPDGTNIKIPDPVLTYFVTDAAQSQDLLEPDLDFTGASVDVDGQTLVLKDIFLPGTQSGPNGLGPTVTILSPKNGDAHFPGKTISLQGEIADGLAPYSYDWQLDDGVSLGGGTLDAAGVLLPMEKDLPSPDNKGTPGSQTVHLIVTDAQNVTREQVVALVSAADIFIPVVMKGGLAGAIPAASLATVTASPIIPMSTNYRFGVEYGSDYPPYGAGGPDLGGVPPDANGLSAGLMGLSWPRVFNWYNSLSWERDWRDCALGGSDCTYGVDRADYVYYSGHGNNGGIAVPSNSHDYSWVDGANARFQNARWVSFSSCLTLRAQWPTAGSEPIRRWFNAFQGAHMLLGFNSTMADIAFGPRLVDNMRLPSYLGGLIELPWAQRTIAEAWVQTAFEMNAGKPAYIYATSASVNPIGNKLPKVTDPLMPRPYPVNWYYWVWWNE